mmetsp:Transcript_27347/g.49214  ORF Transcript_27347/g.49214 Transcript_27347/m.49214 type:complete len:153 (+) Transcript_27347:300-758(+)
MDQLTKEVLDKYWHVRNFSGLQPFELRSTRSVRSQSVPRKRIQQENEELRIEKENSFLYEKLKKIITKPLPPIKLRPHHSLNSESRRKTQLRIQEENKRLSSRLQHIRPVFVMPKSPKLKKVMKAVSRKTGSVIDQEEFDREVEGKILSELN